MTKGLWNNMLSIRLGRHASEPQKIAWRDTWRARRRSNAVYLADACLRSAAEIYTYVHFACRGLDFRERLLIPSADAPTDARRMRR